MLQRYRVTAANYAHHTLQAQVGGNHTCFMEVSSCTSSFQRATLRSCASRPLPLLDHKRCSLSLRLESGMCARIPAHCSGLSRSCCSGSRTCSSQQQMTTVYNSVIFTEVSVTRHNKTDTGDQMDPAKKSVSRREPISVVLPRLTQYSLKAS